MAHEKLRPSYFFDEEKIEQLKQIAPECFEDGKINFDTLRENLGDFTQHEEDPELEHFGLFWPGKRDARKAAALPPEGTLEPVWGDGLKADGTPDTDGINDSKNIFIEGENLEVLKLLQKSYANKIKMIYIDPPYNTGNDFVYDDDFTEPLQEYLRRTGQVDEEGKAMTSNKRSDGRFHSKWLSMMYPRLRLARNLLREDGVIFVSIDDNEVHNLRALMNEVFGEENFVVQIPWQSRLSVQNDTDISSNHEYILSFAKARRQNDRRLKESNMEKWYKEESFAFYPTLLNEDKFENPDDDQRGKWKADPFDAPNIRPNLTYVIKNPNTGEEYLPPEGRCWRTTKSEYEKYLADNRIVFGKSGNSKPQLKVFYNEKKELGSVPNTWFDGATFGTSTSGTKEIQKLFDGVSYFDTVKPTKLIEHLLSLSCRNEDIVLDFFAGSGTTGHAVLEFNEKTNNNIRFICVQIPVDVNEDSLASKKGYRKISEITLERLKNVITNNNFKNGFANKRMIHSNYKPWKNYQGISTTELENQLDLFNQNPLREGYSEDGLLTEIILLEGFTLCSSILPMAEITSNKIRKVSSEYCAHSLLVCLDAKLDEATISNLHLGEADIFICLDSAISTQDKLRLSDKGLIKTI